MNSIQLFSYRFSYSRRVETFAVVPFEEGSKRIKVRSKNRCVIIDLEKKQLSRSEWFRRTPMFIDCSPNLGGKIQPIPNDLLQIVQTLKPKS